MEIKLTQNTSPSPKPDPDKLGFGKLFTDHMFICDYSTSKGWHNARVEPFRNLSLSPACAVFHYAQAMFEGLKAYKTKDGRVLLFRPDKNIERLNNTNERMCIPKIDPGFALEAIKTIVRVDCGWIPSAPGTSLYIRPFIIATDPFLGVHPSNNYMFIIILSPSGNYYAAGLDPVKIVVEDEYVRAVRGGTGYAKVGGNYAASLIGQKKAEENGFAQVLWLDGIHHKYIDEVGAMNVFFKIDGEIITPALEGSILPGVTRGSVIELLTGKGYKVTERRISIDEVYAAANDGRLDEMFGTGTAAVISPVGELAWGDKKMKINGFKIGPVASFLYKELTDIQWGRVDDVNGWTVEVCGNP